jgi:ubiquinol-cytochrome c reductase cytochrome b subunit
MINPETLPTPDDAGDPKPVRALLRRLADVRVPRGDGLTFVVLALVSAFLLVTEATTGVLLALYYRPTLAGANDSVRFIVTEVRYGGLVRAVHYWGAQALIATIGATVAWAALRRAYRSPNALAWLGGVSLGVIAVGEAFTGALLPWSQRSAVDAGVSSALAGQLPLVGGSLRALMLGGPQPGDLSLVRTLGVHAGVLPLLATAAAMILALHAAGSAPARPRGPSMPLAPHAALRGLVAACLMAMAIFALSSLWPPTLGAAAELAREGGASRPSWYLALLHQALRAAPPRMIGVPSATVIATVAALGVGALALFPVVDRRASRAGQVAVLVALATILGGTVRALVH